MAELTMSRQIARHPDFLIIGAPKCGTTWLNRRLAVHPSIAMPQDEVHFFSNHWDRGWDWYANQFPAASADQVTGENSNSYLTEPAACERLFGALPGAKLIALLRHPVERAYSSYGMQVDRGRATSDIDLYLDPLRSPRPHILTNGQYGRMLAPYFKTFAAHQIHLAFFDQIAADPVTLFGEILSFIGVDRSFVPDNLMTRENARKQSGVPGPVKRALWWLRPLLASGPLHAIRTGPVGRAAEAAVARPKSYPPLSPERAARLGAYYASDLDLLETIARRPLDEWRNRYQ